MFNVNNKNTRTTSLTSFWYFSKPLQNIENQILSVFRGYRKRRVTWSGLNRWKLKLVEIRNLNETSCEKFKLKATLQRTI